MKLLPSRGNQPEMFTPLCKAPFDVLAQTHDANDSNHGLQIRWQTSSNKEKLWTVPAETFTGDKKEWFASMVRDGLQVHSPRIAGELGDGIFSMMNNVKRQILAVTRTGWQVGADGAFIMILPERIFGHGEEVAFQSSDLNANTRSNIRTKGTLAEWQDHVGKLCISNPRVAFVVAAAIASPLLLPLGMANVLIHLIGTSSEGKTTAQRVAGSVCGGREGEGEGYMRSWLATANSLDAIAANHCDAALILDELSNISAKDAMNAVFRVYGGAEKARMTKEISLRDQRVWRTVLISSGNVDLVTKANSQNFNPMQGTEEAAQDVRFITVKADSGKYGIFDELHGFADGATFADHMTTQSRRYYGSPYETMVEALVRDLPAATKRVQELMTAIQTTLSAGLHVTGGQVPRVIRSFAFIAAAGEFAIEQHILPWEPGEAIAAAKVCFDAWLAARGTEGDFATMRGVEQVRQYFQQHGYSDFVVSSAEGVLTTQPRESSGWYLGDGDLKESANNQGLENKRDHRTDGKGGWLVWPEVFRNKICRGYDSSAIINVLVEQGHMAEPYDKTPGHGSTTPKLHAPPGAGARGARHRLFRIYRSLIEAENQPASVEPSIDGADLE